VARLTLHQFPISHYCEKIRWVLDRKGLSYTVKNQLPGVHMLVNRRLVGRGSVPLLVDGGHAIGNSSDIALYVDDQFPRPRLIPTDAPERAAVLELEAYFDRHVGPAVRRWVYGFILPRPELFRRVFFDGYDGLARKLGRLASNLLVPEIARMYGVNAASADESWRAIEAGLETLERRLHGDPHRYLVGAHLTLADVTAAALLGPLLAPPESPWCDDLGLRELTERRHALRARPAGQWVLRRYALDRHGEAAHYGS